MNKTYILNVSGGHGHFLQWLLDKFCVSTPIIDTLPFNSIGASHLPYKQSGQFNFIDDRDTEDFLASNNNLNCVMITIDDDILYWERSCIYRAGDAGSDLFSEESIKKFLVKYGSDFPQYCESKNISIKDGYKFSFMDVSKSGARQRDTERKTCAGVVKNNVYFFPLKNFTTKEKLSKSLIDVSKHFNFEVDLTDFSDIYDAWYKQNTLLQTYNDVEHYLNGNTDIKLDLLQQAYVDAHKK